MASGPGISGNLEKSGNLVALQKSQGNVREFCEIGKSQGILLVQNEYRWSLQDSFKWWTRISHGCSYMFIPVYVYILRNEVK